MGCSLSTNKNSQEDTKSTITLPLVDFTPFSSSSDSHEKLRHTAHEIDKANRHHGFVCLRNSGISKQTIQNAFDASKDLFSLNDTHKENRLKPLDPTSNTGYVGYGQEALNRNRQTDLKEAFNVRGNSLDDGTFGGTPKLVSENVMNLWREFQQLGNLYAKCCAMALGLEEEYFSKTLKDMDLCTLRLLHYPPCSEHHMTPTSTSRKGDEESNRCAIRVGEHTDFGIFTFLLVYNFEDESSLGLQIKQPGSGSGSSGEWKTISFDRETIDLIHKDETAAILVNTGALLARWTNDVWTATAHRVIVTPESYLSHRYSIAMFLDPDKDTICSVHDSFVPEGEDPKYEDIKSIDYLLMKLREAQGQS